MIGAALSYARCGWPVFPCRGKLPAIPASQGGRGVLDATTDEVTIRYWWQQGFNIGIRCGVAFFAIDLDEKPGISGRDSLAQLEEEHGFIEDTVEQITPTGGRHLLFRIPDGVEIRNSASKLGPGIDTRGVNGYILAAPSVHPVTGTRYEWHPDLHPDRVPIAMAPDWLIKLLCEAPAELVSGNLPKTPPLRAHLSSYASAALESAVRRIVEAPAGSQETTLNGEAFSIGRLAGGGVIPAGVALDSMLWAARRMPSLDPRRPWRSVELERKVKLAFSDGLREPRGVPDAR